MEEKHDKTLVCVVERCFEACPVNGLFCNAHAPTFGHEEEPWFQRVVLSSIQVESPSEVKKNRMLNSEAIPAHSMCKFKDCFEVCMLNSIFCALHQPRKKAISQLAKLVKK
jgi:hypothetical protein